MLLAECGHFESVSAVIAKRTVPTALFVLSNGFLGEFLSLFVFNILEGLVCGQIQITVGVILADVQSGSPQSFL